MHRQLLPVAVLIASLCAVSIFLPGGPPVAARQASPAAGTPCPTTTEEANEAFVRSFYEEAWNQGNVQFLDEVWAPTAAVALPVTQPATRDILKERILEFRSAFPDIHVDVKIVLTDGDHVVAGVVRTGTQLGEFDGAPPSGRTADWSALELFRFDCGQVVDYWNESNALDLRRDLGIITEEELASVEEATPEP